MSRTSLASLARAPRSLLLALVLAAAAPSAGCAHAATKVEAGESPTTGDATYDDFFKAVLDAREEAKKADDEETSARDELARVVGADAGAIDAMVERTADRAKKLHDFGVLMHLELLPTARLVVARHGDSADGGDGEALVRAVETAANKSMALAKRLGELGTRAASLEKQRVELREGTATKLESMPASQRKDVEKELDGCKALLDEAGTTGARVAGDASRFLLGLARAVETGAADDLAKPPEACPPAKGAKKGAAPPPRGRASKPAASPSRASAQAPAASPAPAKKPARKGKPSDDFEP
jgi:hypothetical protein